MGVWSAIAVDSTVELPVPLRGHGLVVDEPSALDRSSGTRAVVRDVAPLLDERLDWIERTA